MNLHSPEDAKNLEAAVLEALQNGTGYDLDLTVIMPSEQKKFLHIIGKTVKDEDGNVTNIKGTIQDITERKQAEEALKESEEKFRNMTEQINEIIFLTDDKGKIKYISPCFFKYFWLHSSRNGRSVIYELFKEN